jgi:hypothetical protein
MDKWPRNWSGGARQKAKEERKGGAQSSLNALTQLSQASYLPQLAIRDRWGIRIIAGHKVKATLATYPGYSNVMLNHPSGNVLVMPLSTLTLLHSSTIMTNAIRRPAPRSCSTPHGCHHLGNLCVGRYPEGKRRKYRNPRQREYRWCWSSARPPSRSGSGTRF